MVGQSTSTPLISDNQWIVSASGLFSVKSCFDLLESGGHVLAPVKML